VLPIFIRTHQKELYGLVRREFILNAFALKVVPIQDDLEVRTVQSVYTKVDVSDATPEACVPANLHQQMLLLRVPCVAPCALAPLKMSYHPPTCSIGTVIFEKFSPIDHCFQ